MSSNGNIFCVIGPLCGEFTGYRWGGALMFSLICAWINGWVNNREAGDLRRHRAHHDVSLIMSNHILRKAINGVIYPCRYLSHTMLLTHWSRDKIAAFFQTTFSSAFSCMKMLEFRLKFHWSLFLRVQLTIVRHWFRWWLGTYQATSHYLKQWWLDYWRIYASLGLNELKGFQVLHRTIISYNTTD